MAVVDLAALTAPVADGDPCGPDLDLAGDAEFMNFLARAEGLLPASFYDSEGKTFDRATIDFDAEFDAMKPLLAKTRDLRLLVLLAKLLILNRDLEGFTTCISAVATLLREHWEEVHPRGEDGDFLLRTAALSTLDDVPPVLMPLQYLPLAEHRRFGMITYRHQMIAGGQASLREGEEVPDAAAIEQAFGDIELTTLVARRDLFATVQGALADIRKISVERAGFEQAVSLERLPPLVDKMLAFLDSAVAKRDPAAALGATAGTAAEGSAAMAAKAAPATGKVRSNADAAAALSAVADYFSRHEPSNPALLLARQAEQLIGKSFLDVIRILVPGYVEQAIIHIGGDHTFELPVERLSEFSFLPESWPQDDGSGSDENGVAESIEPDETDGQSGEAEGRPEGADGAGTADSADEEAIGPVEQDLESAGADLSSGSAPTPASDQIFRATSRHEAVVLLDHVGVYYRSAEPSSPIPYLTDRARTLAERDFLSLLKDFLPESALKSVKDENG